VLQPLLWHDDHLLSGDFGPCGIMLMNVSVVTVVAMARRSFAVKGFWALWDNVYE
jgi:hypothetical protein